MTDMRSIISQVIDDAGGYDACSEPSTDGAYRTIRADKVEVLTDALQAIVAELVAVLIDAGSEREVVMENDTLHDAIANELKDWAA